MSNDDDTIRLIRERAYFIWLEEGQPEGELCGKLGDDGMR
jgi:hypothetical protein